MKPRIAVLVASVLLCVPLALAGISMALTAPAHGVVAAPPDLAVTPFSVSSAEGATIRGWFMRGATDKGGVLLLHGIGASRLAMIARMRFLNDAGYSVAAIDFRAHGESTGDRIALGTLESADARAAFDWLRSQIPGRKVGIIGQSLGGAAALLGEGPIPADALVLESVYPDIDRAIDDRLTNALGGLGHIMTPALIAVGQMVTGLDPARLRPIDAVARVESPVFIVSGTVDYNTRIDEAREMFDRAHDPKEFWAVDNVGHEDIYFRTNEVYRQKILAFFRRHL